jgi:hypothetical protein
MKEMQPHQFVVLAQFLTPVNNLAVADYGNFGILHELPGLIAVATVEQGGPKNFIRHGSLSFRPFREELRFCREAGQEVLERF